MRGRFPDGAATRLNTKHSLHYQTFRLRRAYWIVEVDPRPSPRNGVEMDDSWWPLTPYTGFLAENWPSTSIPQRRGMLAGMRKARDRFRWDYYASPEEVVHRRREVFTAFISDFRTEIRSGLYVSARLPELPFLPKSFDLVLCSHLLFLYSAEFDSEAHLSFLREMLRVGREVRVFPLLDMDGAPSVHLEGTVQKIRASAQVELVPLPFEFRIGDSKMLRLTD